MASGVENENISIDVSQAPGCQVSFKVRLKPTFVKKLHDKAFKGISKEVSLPGFRKGKAPKEMLLKRFAGSIEQEWKSEVLNAGFQEGLELTGMSPLRQESVKQAKVISCSLEDGAEINVEFEALPVIPTVDFTQIVVEEELPPAIKESDIEGTLLDLARYKAVFEERAERPSQEKDRVHVELFSLQGEEATLLNANVYFDLNSEETPAWLCQALLGKKVDDIVEMESQLHPEASEEEKAAFTPMRYRAKVLKIEESVLPAIDDAFAKLIGATSLEDLKDKISKRMQKELEDNRQQEMSEKATQALLDKLAFDVPATALKEEIDYRTSRELAELKKQKLSEEELKEKKEKLQETLQGEALNALRLHFMARHYLSREAYAISKEDLSLQVNMLRPFMGKRQPSKEEMQHLYSQAYSILMTKKFKEYLLGQVQCKTKGA